jgi:hypothetical protein
VLVAYLIYESKKAPSPTDAENWMRDTGKPWAKEHPAPEDPVTATISPSSFSYSSDVQTVNVNFKSKATTEQEVSSITLNLISGPSGPGLFFERTNYTVDDTAAAGHAKLAKAPEECRMEVGNNPSTLVTTDTRTTLTIKKPKPPTPLDFTGVLPPTLFKLAIGGEVTVTLYGKVQNDKGDFCTLDWSFVTKDDVTQGYLSVTRAKKTT